MNNFVIEVLNLNEQEAEKLKFYLENKNIINLFDDIEKLHLSERTNFRISALKNVIADAMNILSE